VTRATYHYKCANCRYSISYPSSNKRLCPLCLRRKLVLLGKTVVKLGGIKVKHD